MKIITPVLLLGVMGTAMTVVHTQHAARRDFVAVEDSKSTLRQLQLENARLDIEVRAQATPLRVETLAKSRLNMKAATPSITQYLEPSLSTPNAKAGSQ